MDSRFVTSSLAAAQQRLQTGLAELPLSLSAASFDALMRYLAALLKWNQAFNLTAVRDPVAMVEKHLLDSLTVLPFLDDSPLLDVGTGAGLPGLVLALVRPTLPVTLLDSNSKKTRFLRQHVASESLAQVTVVHARCEQHQGQYGQITSRAFASLADMVQGTQHLLQPGGRWLAMKGHLPLEEISALPPSVTVTKSHELAVPFDANARHVLVLQSA